MGGPDNGAPTGGQLGHAIKWARMLGGRVLALEFGDKGAMTAMLGRVSAYSEGRGGKGMYGGVCTTLCAGFGSPSDGRDMILSSLLALPNPL